MPRLAIKSHKRRVLKTLRFGACKSLNSVLALHQSKLSAIQRTDYCTMSLAALPEELCSHMATLLPRNDLLALRQCNKSSATAVRRSIQRRLWLSRLALCGECITAVCSGVE